MKQDTLYDKYYDPNYEPYDDDDYYDHGYGYSTKYDDMGFSNLDNLKSDMVISGELFNKLNLNNRSFIFTIDNDKELKMGYNNSQSYKGLIKFSCKFNIFNQIIIPNNIGIVSIYDNSIITKIDNNEFLTNSLNLEKIISVKDYFNENRDEIIKYIINTRLPYNNITKFKELLNNISFNECLYCVNKNPQIVICLEDKEMTEDNLIKLIKTNENVMNYIPKVKITNSYIKKCIDTDTKLVQLIPKEMLNDEINFYIFDKDPQSIKKIPKEKLSYELYKHAVSKDGRLVDYHKQYYKDNIDELVPLAINSGNYYLKSIPEEYHTLELCNQAVIINPINVKYVKKELKNFDMIKSVAKKNINTINITEFTNEEIHELIKVNPKILSLVNSPTNEMIIEALKKDGMLIRNIKKNVSFEMCKVAIEQNNNAYFWIPEKFKKQFKIVPV